METGIRTTLASIVCCDNLCATYIASNLIFHTRTKHVEVNFHFIKRFQTAIIKLLESSPNRCQPLGMSLTKHVEVDFHFIRRLQMGILKFNLPLLLSSFWYLHQTVVNPLVCLLEISCRSFPSLNLQGRIKVIVLNICQTRLKTIRV